MKQIILMSIRPEWVAKILNGEKTIEVRKHALKEGDEVHIYATKHNHHKNSLYLADDGKYETDYYIPSQEDFILNGKVVAKFIVGKVETMEWKFKEVWSGDYSYYDIQPNDIPLKACLSIQQLNDYGKGQTLYALSITHLEIFDKPRELGEYTKRIFGRFPFGWGTAYTSKQIPITKAPQSFQKAWVE